jgi:hypothetical protein
MLDRFDQFDDRTLEIATVVVVILIALVLLCYLSIFINPQVFFNPFKPPTPAAIAEVTKVVVETPWTSTPTNTATNTPTATSTSTPAPTNTPRPPRPTKPPPPPTPYPYDYTVSQAGPDCERTWVWGYVVDTDGLGEPNVQVRVGSVDGWRGDVWTDVNGYYEAIFAWEPKAGQWFVRVFKGGQSRSMQYWFKSSAGCDGLYSLQQFHIDWRHR